MITADNASQVEVTAYEHQRYCAYASDLGLAPGRWPQSLSTSLGNRLPFLYRSVQSFDGDVVFAVYEQANGCIELKIFND